MKENQPRSLPYQTHLQARPLVEPTSRPSYLDDERASPTFGSTRKTPLERGETRITSPNRP